MKGITSAAQGFVARAAELRTSRAGKAFLTFTAGIPGREESAEPQWLRVAYFGDDATDLAERLIKGVEVYVEGRIELNVWTDKEGAEHTQLQLMAWVCQPLGQVGRRRPQGERSGRGTSSPPDRAAAPSSSAKSSRPPGPWPPRNPPEWPTSNARRYHDDDVPL